MSITLDITATNLTDITGIAELEAEAEAAFLLDAQAKELSERAKSAKEALKAKLDKRGLLNGDTKAVGHIRTVIKQVRRFDEALAKSLLTPAEVEKYSVSKLDSVIVKRNVTPDVFEMFQKDFGHSLELKVLED